MSADFIERDPEDGSEFFRTKSDNNQYGLVQGGSYAGNNLAKCFAQLSFPKTNFDEEWFGTYEFLHGARVYTNSSSTEFVELAAVQVTQDFSPPAYTDAELIAEIEAVDNIYKYEVISQSSDFDAGIVFGYDANVYTGNQEIVGTFYISPDATAD